MNVYGVKLHKSKVKYSFIPISGTSKGTRNLYHLAGVLVKRSKMADEDREGGQEIRTT